MVSDPSDSPTKTDSDPDNPKADGTQSVGFDEARLYTVVRDAVTDALLDVIGTILLVGIGFVLVVAGGQAALGTISPSGMVLGILVATLGFYVAAVALELVPSVRNLL